VASSAGETMKTRARRPLMRQGTWETGSARPVVITVLAGLNAGGAAGGALGLAFGFLELDAVSASRLPWGSTVLAGIALGLLVGVPNAVLAVVAARRGAGTGLSRSVSVRCCEQGPERAVG
jgi:hypothetical protein